MKFIFKGTEYYIDGYLSQQLDNIVYNITRDNDAVIVISGDRMVRVGKSVLAMTVCSYLCQAMQKAGIQTDYSQNDIYFDSATMAREAINKPKYSINHYDEGRETLDSSKYALQMQRDLLDFFAECGQLNQIFVIVLPDFFQLKEEVAVARSEMLLNVYRVDEVATVNLYGDGPRDVVRFTKGNFEFFSRKKKRLLYDIYRTTRRKDYSAVKRDFYGAFTNQYPIDEEVYRRLKMDALLRFKEEGKQTKSKREERLTNFRDAIVLKYKNDGLSGLKVSELLKSDFDIDLSSRTINTIFAKHTQDERRSNVYTKPAMDGEET